MVGSASRQGDERDQSVPDQIIAATALART
jgi:hypothetical protein